ncbi:sulfate/molybdate ABC transporter ATP-binding protein [Brevundimonas lenta]|uniref:Sulfate transport system ATP-binding protein n=1 Tax=Brevundimonas lenta TaxID=424796 RepID=A0A7W6JBY2_9CAUL|nr:sulfate/molybdate ABC transporter ATP-binding protein [Brevundimonas lenta]MBB4082211.1 sulfate transport system ATP-binding protein [Brevundimonas lenta]
MPLEVTAISKSFGRFAALDDVSLKAADGEFLALLGPSGSGKTTLLRILAGLETPDAGSVRFDNEDFLKQTPRERRIGLVFQHYALFRHMTVARNIAFGLKVRPRRDRPTPAVIAQRVEELLALVQLKGLGGRYPAQLSGGQRQRVALARALAIEPRMLLLDEPFGALDAKVRRDLRRWLRHIHNETGITTVFVTHDQEEALDLADRVAILKDGVVQQLDTPQALYERPANPFVHDFLGAALHRPGVVSQGRLQVDGWETAAPPGAPEGEVLFCTRPDDLTPADQGLEARVLTVSPRGARVRIECRIGKQTVDTDRGLDDPLARARPGETIRLAPQTFHLFPR